MRNFKVVSGKDGKFIACKVTTATLTPEQAETIAELFGMDSDQITTIHIDAQSVSITHAVYEESTND